MLFQVVNNIFTIILGVGKNLIQVVSSKFQIRTSNNLLFKVCLQTIVKISWT